MIEQPIQGKHCNSPAENTPKKTGREVGYTTN